MPKLHQYIDRETSEVKTENLYYDRIINGLYSSVQEQNPVIFKVLTSSRATAVLGFLNYDFSYYGFFNACACTLAAFIFLLLLGAVNVPPEMAVAFFIMLMTGMIAVYSVMIALLFPAAAATVPSISAGLRSLWHPSFIVLFQLFWIIVFVYTGKSLVTGSQISFHVRRDRI